MNKRARNRLIGITAIILLILVAVFITVLGKSAATNLTVKQFTAQKVTGKRVQITGTVVNGSWNKRTNPMEFKIRDDTDTRGTGPVVAVQYTGSLPETFGDGVQAVVTGTYETQGDYIKSTDMTTKCPSKYATATDAYTVQNLLQRKDAMVGIPIKLTGVVKPGSLGSPGTKPRFLLLNAAGATDQIAISFEGGIASNIKDNVKVVVTGELNQSGDFAATAVALAK